ncbi:peptidoglycan recognition protein family protein [Nocardiopsis chromatogenes]|uniref:peptidoglycan recognition protein family protein n=1 Tax=Nocardiopsis chromatogenes TaxID=280239 RepID=UPI000344A09E|nr:N-acetylmuramoyl-L-alanine amidase [Nocardiopsis chromatogenes]
MVSIVPRSGWGARAPRSRSTTSWSQRRGVTVHYSAGPPGQSVRSIQDFHMDGNGWADIGYNFLVDTSGTAYEGRGWLTVGAHAAPYNTSHIGICFIGQDGDATGAAKAAIRALYDEANRRAGRTLSKTGHRDLNQTSCPGDDLAAWVRAGMPADAGQIGDDDMVGLSKGDIGERVKYLQVILMKAGFDLPEFGADGHYGAETEKAVLAARKSQGSDQDFGDRITGWAAAQIMAAFTKNQI